MPRSSVSPVLLALPLLLSACATGGGGAGHRPADLPDRYSVIFTDDVPAHETMLDAPIDRVNELVPVVYEFLGLPLDPASRARDRLHVTPNMRIQGQLYPGEKTSAYLDCGSASPGGPRADLPGVRFAIVTRLREGGDGETVVETLMSGTAPRDAVTGGTIRCRGTGKLEGQIAQLLRQHVREAAASNQSE